MRFITLIFAVLNFNNAYKLYKAGIRDGKMWFYIGLGILMLYFFL